VAWPGKQRRLEFIGSGKVKEQKGKPLGKEKMKRKIFLDGLDLEDFKETIRRPNLEKTWRNQKAGGRGKGGKTQKGGEKGAAGHINRTISSLERTVFLSQEN